MKKEIISITGYKGAVLHGILWTPDEEPKAMLHEEGSGCAMQVRKMIREWILEKGEK